MRGVGGTAVGGRSGQAAQALWQDGRGDADVAVERSGGLLLHRRRGSAPAESADALERRILQVGDDLEFARRMVRVARAGRGERLQAGLGHSLEQPHSDEVRCGAHRHVRRHVQRLARGVGQRVLGRQQRVGCAVGIGARDRLVRRDAQHGLATVECRAGVGDQALFKMAAEARVGNRIAAGVAVAREHHHRVERAGLRGRALTVLGMAGDARRLLELGTGLARLRGEDRVAGFRVRAGKEGRVE